MSFSAFTPSTMPPELLEAVFTAREDLATEIFNNIEDGIEQEERRAIMLIGPRGIGKTFFVSLLRHRVKAQKALDDKVRVAWLAEDPDSIASYATLLREIVMSLDRAYSIPGIKEVMADVLSRNNDDERIFLLEGALLDFLDGKVLFLIAENFHTILDALDTSGQRKLRALLQTVLKNPILLCTSTSLVPDINDREAAFHGFFYIKTLYPFTFEDCVRILVRLAEAHKDQPLANFLRTPKARARVRAVHHLAGGNPRVYVIFFDFLSIESLDSLMEPFRKLIDDLTPYYQSRMLTLSPRQRQYVEIMRRNIIPMAVKEIAKEAFAPQTSASKDLGRLVDLGYLESRKIGRESLYELREPLMRICLSIKDAQGSTVPLFVEFLRVWFIDGSEAQDGRVGQAKLWLENQDYSDALKHAESQYSAKTAFLLKSIEDEDPDVALAKLEALHDATPGDIAVWVALRRRLEQCENWEELVLRAQMMTERYPDEAWSWSELRFAYGAANKVAAALDASKRAVELNPDDPLLVSTFLRHVAALRLGDQYAEEIAAQLSKVDAKLEGDADISAEWLWAKASGQEALDDIQEASQTMIQYLRQKPDNYSRWRSFLILLQNCNADKALVSVNEAVAEHFSGDYRAWRDLAVSFITGGQPEYAISALQKAEELGEKTDELTALKFRVHFDMGELRAARTLEPHVLEAFDKLRTKTNGLGLSYLRTLDGRIDEAEEWVRLVVDYYFARGETRRIGSPLWIAKFGDHHEILTETAKIWLDVFRGYPSGLSHLGNNLVRHVLSPYLELPEDRMLHWCDIWDNVSKELPEMIIPLRIMRAAVRYRFSLDEDDLMTLPVEERAMLREPIRRFLEGIGREQNPLDSEVEALIEEVQDRWKTAKLEQEKKDRRTRRAKKLDDIPVDAHPTEERLKAALESYRATAKLENRIDPLFDTKWKGVPKKDVHALVSGLVQTDEKVARLLAHPEVYIRRIDAGKLSFVTGELYQTHMETPAGTASLDFWSDGSDFVIFEGTGPSPRKLVQRGSIKITDQTIIPYIQFHNNQLRGSDGRFLTILLDDKAALNKLKKVGLDFADLDKAIVAAADAGSPTDDVSPQKPELTALVVNNNVAFVADFVVKDRTTGLVSMLNDNPFSEKALALPREEFIGYLRLWNEV